MPAVHRALAAVAASVLLLAACGDDASPAGSTDGAAGRPTLVVTTSLLGDVVAEMAGEQAEVRTIMPAGADPHDFSASARQAVELREADVVVTNGGGFEEGLLDVIESAESDGVAVVEALDGVTTLDGGEDHEHEDGGADPHFFTDPARTAQSVRRLAEELAEIVPALDTDEFRAGAEAYALDLDALDDEVEAILAEVPADDRVLVTNHDVFAYFADRYGFEIVGTVIPAGSTSEGASGGELAELAEVIEAEGVPAVFADTSSPDDVARALADEVGADVAVIELYSESLGEAGSDGATYIAMVRTNARRIADALA